MRALSVAMVALGLAATGMPTEEPRVRFDGHKVLTVQLDTPAKVAAVRALGWDVWSHDSTLIEGANDVRVPPTGAATLRNLNVSYTEMIGDVQAAVEATMRRSVNATRRQDGTQADPWFDSYHTFADLTNWYQQAAAKYSQIASFQVVGSSVQGRNLGMLTIDARPRAGKKRAYIQAGIHAREWISPATTNYIVNELLEGYAAGNAEVVGLLEAVTVYVVPSVNPDGYEFTWQSNRMWRKNRRPNGGSSFGVDLNRNYGSHWGCCGGSSGDPNSDTYRGPRAFSEPESDALSRVVLSLRPNGGIDMHSYSQLILRAWGWTRTNTPDEAALRDLGAQMRTSIAGPYGTQYTNQKSIDLYVTDGTASDWFYDPQEGAGAKWSYTIELRDTGRYGFVLPPEQIVPSGEETFLGIKDWLRYIANN